MSVPLVALVALALVLPVPAEAGFWANLKQKMTPNKGADGQGSNTYDNIDQNQNKYKNVPKNKAEAEDFWKKYESASPENLLYREPSRQYIRKLKIGWSYKTPLPVFDETLWMGSTYKEVSMTKEEFDTLRNKLVNRELNKLKEEHIKRKKLQVQDDEDVKLLLDDFLAGGKVDEKKKQRENEKYLADFNEDLSKRQILKRLIVPQTRLQPTDALYYQLNNRDLYCVDLKTSVTIWISRLDEQIKGVPYETERAVYVMVGNYLYIIDKRSGYALHKMYMKRAVMDIPFATETTVFMAGFRDRLYSMDPKLNIIKWQRKLTGRPALGLYGSFDGIFIPQENGEFTSYGFDGRKRWTFVNKGVSEEKVYLELVIRDLQGKILTEESQARKDERQPDTEKISMIKDKIKEAEVAIDELKDRTRASYEAAPSFEDDFVYVGSTDFNLYKINRYTGLPEWQYICNGPVRKRALIGSHAVWQLDERSNLHAVNKETGKEIEIIPDVDQLIQVKDNVVYYLKDGKVLVHGKNFDGYVSGIRNLELLIDHKNQMVTHRKGSSKLTFYKFPAFDTIHYSVSKN